MSMYMSSSQKTFCLVLLTVCITGIIVMWSVMGYKNGVRNSSNPKQITPEQACIDKGGVPLMDARDDVKHCEGIGMREIKFRAWQKDSSYGRAPGMYKVVDIIWYTPPQDGKTGEVFFDGEDSSEYLEDVELMQYTGLKDKNGVEIFEGDIVEEDSLGRPQTVFYSTDHAGFKLGFNGDNTQYDKRESLWADYCKVVGNIYDNPELLK